MKSTGFVRKVDQLGRIVMPIELRRTIGVSAGNPMEIFIEEDKIILNKYETDRTCAVTGELLNENVESKVINGLYLSQRGAEILLEELQNKTQR